MAKAESSAVQFAVMNNQSSVNTESERPAKETRVSLPSLKPNGKTGRLSTL